MTSKTILTALLAIVLFTGAVTGQSGTIEEIYIQGLGRMSDEAAMHALGVKVGDPYDPAELRLRFREMFKLGLFKWIVFEVEQGPKGGMVLVVKVEELPYLTSVSYEDNKILSRTQIEDRLKEKDIRIGLGKPLDMKVIAEVESEIRDYLAEKGYLDSEVSSTIDEITATTRGVHFRIKTGGKTRIKDIEFVGNEVFSDRKLKNQLKLTQERQWYWPWSQKSLYHPIKWDQDVANIRELYQNHGYLDVQIRPPVVDFKEKRTEPKPPEESAGKKDADDDVEQPAEPVADSTPDFEMTPEQAQKEAEKRAKKAAKARKKAEKEEQKAQPKVKKSVTLTVPVVEGPQYTTGKIEIEGNTVFTDAQLRSGILLAEGGILRNGAIDAGVDAISRLYEDRGHLYASVVRQIQRHEDEAVADITINIDEDQPFFIEKIEFVGNTSTQDKVLRREVQLTEGMLFNRTRIDLSKGLINRLGYVEAPEDPIIEPVEGENRVRVRFPVIERGRNEIQVGGGYSGVDGAFFSGVYSTRNFLGRGQTLSLALQIGGRSNRYQISFIEPWFLNRPYTLGFSLFLTDSDFGGSFTSTSKGFGIVLGKRIAAFTDMRLNYDYQSVSSTSVVVSPGLVGDNVLTSTADNDISSITPVFTFDRINNPYRPSFGGRFTFSFQIAGGPLGGDTSYLKPMVQYTKYKPLAGKPQLAFNAQAGMVRTWSFGTVNNSATINGVPRFQRFWLGGDTFGPRVFQTRTITPLRYVRLNPEGSIGEVLGDPRFQPVQDFVNSGGVVVPIEVGGDRFYLLQTELVLPLNEQAEIGAFLDIGDALFEDQSFGFESARVSAGFEVRFYLPVFPVPIRLIYGWPIRKFDTDRFSNFTFSIGKSF